MFRWIDIKSMTVDSIKKLFAEVYPHEVVSIFPGKKERLFLLSEVGPLSQQDLEDEVDGEDDNDEKNGMDGGKNSKKEEESQLGDSGGGGKILVLEKEMKRRRGTMIRKEEMKRRVKRKKR